MVKRQRHRNNISKHIKSSHKKSTLNRKVAFKKVDKNLKNINHIISKEMDKAAKLAKQRPLQQANNKIELQTISADDLKKLLSGEKTKEKTKNPRINLDQSLVLEKMVKKWNADFESMAKDIKLNRMQWTAKQIQKKNEAYQKILEEQKQNNQ